MKSSRANRPALMALSAVAAVYSLTAASPNWDLTIRASGLATAFILAYSLVEMVPLYLPRGGRMSIAVGVSVVSIILLPLGPALAVQFAGQLVGAALDENGARSQQVLRDVVRRGAALSAGYGVFRACEAMLSPSSQVGGAILALVLAGGVYMVFDLVGYVVFDLPLLGASMRQSVISLVGLVGWAYLSQLSVGVVFVLVVDGLGLLAAPILLLLMLLLQSSFSLLLRVRTAYLSTVAALARLAEKQSPESAGHAERVAALCVAIGRRLRMSQDALEALSFAATLHDIGYLKLADSGGRTIAESGLDPDTAEAGAFIIDSVEFLAPAARILHAYAVSSGLRQRQELGHQDMLSAAVLEIACLFDHADRSYDGASLEALLDSVGATPTASAYPQVLNALAVLAAMERSSA